MAAPLHYRFIFHFQCNHCCHWLPNYSLWISPRDQLAHIHTDIRTAKFYYAFTIQTRWKAPSNFSHRKCMCRPHTSLNLNGMKRHTKVQDLENASIVREIESDFRKLWHCGCVLLFRLRQCSRYPEFKVSNYSAMFSAWPRPMGHVLKSF